MPIDSRWTAPIPNCSLHKWIFGSSFDPLPDTKAFIDPERPDTHFVTFAGYRLLAKRLALGLVRAGLQPGDRVLLFSGNSLFFPAAFVGILMARGVFTGANPGFVPRELAYQLADSGARFMIASAKGLDTAVRAAEEVGIPESNVFVFDTTIPDSGEKETKPPGGTRHWTDLLAPEEEALAWDWVEPEDSRSTLCCLNYSSGTTGVPKGVEITHHNYVANGIGVVSIGKLRPDYQQVVDRMVPLCFLPLYHVYSQTFFIANFAQQRVPVYVMPQYDFQKMLSHIQKYRVTHLVAVPPILVQLTKHPLTKKYDLSSLEHVGSGAAPLGRETAAETKLLLSHNPDAVVRQGWGMTEVTCTAITWAADNVSEEPSVGELMHNCRARLVGADGKEIKAANEAGELWIAGPSVMRGYWKNEKATRETLVEDEEGTRWLRTGDVAYVDKYRPGGLFFVVDRVKELIKVKGNQVAPAELEALLLEREDIVDVAVVGVTIDGEELPRAYVVSRHGAEKGQDRDIMAWLEERVAKHKRLRGGVVFVDAIPKNPSGKILRKILREQAKNEVGDKAKVHAKLS